MDLPEVEVIGLKAAKRLFQHSHGNFFLAPVSANLGHHERLLTFPFKRFSQPFFTQAIVVFPGIVKESHSVIQRLGHDFIGSLIGFGRAEMVSAQSHSRDLNTSASQRFLRNLA